MSINKELPVWAVSLGCPKNRVDSERLLGSLGIRLKTCSHIAKSRLVFINTCAFIEPATRESIREILKVINSVKHLKRKPLIVVAGCMPGRYDVQELRKELPEVDLWLTPDQIDLWAAKIIQALNLLHSPALGRVLSPENVSYSWLKISDGCNHSCSFCSIPFIRGKLCSERSSKIIEEARFILSKGIKELVLVAQDVGSWGSDMPDSPERLADLLRKLASLPGLRWLRLLYLYPASITENLLRMMANLGEPVLPYFDVPFQHSEPEILQSMGRPFNSNPKKIVENIRKYFSNAALRTTLIVGYPGETEAQFQKLLAFIEEVKFHNLGVFTFCAEDGTKAAALPGQLPDKVKEERKAEVLKAQAGISQKILSNYVGNIMDVLVDKSDHAEWPGLHIGRVWFQAPEIDGITYVSGPDVKSGCIIRCDIDDSKIYDLVALQSL